MQKLTLATAVKVAALDEEGALTVKHARPWSPSNGQAHQLCRGPARTRTSVQCWPAIAARMLISTYHDWSAAHLHHL